MTPLKIDGCVALVTGANRGIGEALVQALLQGGARKVYATARQPALLEPLIAQDPRVVPLALDVSRPEQAQAAAQQASDVTLLINNAGIAHYGVTLLDDAAPANLQEELDVNLFGILHMFRAFWRVIVRNQGAIANVLSGAALQHNAMLGTYSCTKAAALSMTIGMRTLLRERDILVSSVIVGGVDTRLAKDVPSFALKTPPSVVATAILAGIEQGEEDIDTDPGALATRARVARNPKKAERHHDIRLRGLPALD